MKCLSLFTDVLHRLLRLIILRCCFVEGITKVMQNAGAKRAELLFWLIRLIVLLHGSLIAFAVVLA